MKDDERGPASSCWTGRLPRLYSTSWIRLLAAGLVVFPCLTSEWRRSVLREDNITTTREHSSHSWDVPTPHLVDVSSTANMPAGQAHARLDDRPESRSSHSLFRRKEAWLDRDVVAINILRIPHHQSFQWNFLVKMLPSEKT